MRYDGNMKSIAYITALSLLTACAQPMVEPVSQHHAGMPTSANEMLTWIESNTDYRRDGSYVPPVIMVSEATIAVMTNNRNENLQVNAIYDYLADTIYFNQAAWNTMSQGMATSVILHELVHHMQEVNGALDRCDVEIEAYTLQAQFAREFGVDTSQIEIVHGYKYQTDCMNRR